MAKTDFEWQSECRYISDVTDKHGKVPATNNDASVFMAKQYKVQP